MKCEVCGCEHDGSYGSGRFCSEHCRRSYCGKKGGGSKPGRKMKPDSGWIQRSYYGRWRCHICNLIFDTRKDKFEHNKLFHSTVDANGRRIAWNKGKSKNTDARVMKCVETLKRRIADGEVIPHNRGRKMPEWVRRKLSLTTGGYRRGAGYGKSGWHRGIWCDSSWELAFVIYCLDNGIWIKRSSRTFEYEFNGTVHKYHPDFEYRDGRMIEIKGYTSPQWEAKLSQLPEWTDIEVIDKDGISMYVEYARSKFGVDFTTAYEKK